MRLYILLVVGLGVFGAGVAKARADEIPENYKPAIKKGLAWLAKQQNADGSWPAQGTDNVAAFTGFAGLAMLMDGGSPSKGPYADNLKKAADWYFRNCQTGGDDGLLGPRPNGRTASGYMFGHGYGMLFLASVYASEDDRPGSKEFKDLLQRARRREYREVLKRAVQFTVKAQSSTGGWFYVSCADGQDADEPTATLCQIQALRAVQLAGIDVPKAALDKGDAYLAKITSKGGGVCYGSRSTSERPGLTVAAIACAFKPGDYGSELAKKWLKYAQFTAIGAPPLGGQPGYEAYNLLHTAQVMHGLGETGYNDLFGPGRGLKWSAYRKQRIDAVAGSQQADGSWSSRDLGPVFTTAVHLIVLQLDGEAVPIFSAKKSR